MLKAIVYSSNTGFTKKYANMLETKLNLPAFTVDEAKENLQNNEDIIYLGWVRANKIVNYKVIKKLFNVKYVCAVGANVKSEKNTKNIKSANNISNTLFYLQGGINFNELKGINRLVIKLIGRIIKKSNKDKPDLVSEVFTKGADFVKEENLYELMEYIKEKEI